MLDLRCQRVRATEHTSRDPFDLFERRRGLAQIVERGVGIKVGRQLNLFSFFCLAYPRGPNPRLDDHRAMAFVMLKALVPDAGLDRVKQLAFLPVAACLLVNLA